MNLLVARSLPLAIRTPGMMYFFADHEFLSFTDDRRVVAEPAHNDGKWGSVTGPQSTVRSWTRQA